MTNFKLEPFDVIVVDGLWYMPHHWLIRWRGLDKGVHCCLASPMMLSDGQCGIVSPEFTGMQMRSLSHYKGRRVTIHRYNRDRIETSTLKKWLQLTLLTSHGYDFRQWVMGFLLGLTCKKWVDDSSHWTCAELPYWMFQENGNVTPNDEVLPMPRLFRYNPSFDIVYDGIW